MCPLLWLVVGVPRLVIYQNHGNKNEIALPKADISDRQKRISNLVFKKLICKDYLYINGINNLFGIFVIACQLFYSLYKCSSLLDGDTNVFTVLSPNQLRWFWKILFYQKHCWKVRGFLLWVFENDIERWTYICIIIGIVEWLRS